MIRIKRTQAPPVLTKSRNQRRYRFTEVRQALFEMQRGKCCYCELAISEDDPDKNVEHFRPQSRFECLKNEWDNLLYACWGCNGKKGAKFPKTENGDPLLLDPSDPSLDPEDHIEFVVSDRQDFGRIPSSKMPRGMAVSRGQSLKGKKSIEVLNLSGEHHTRRRRDTWSKLMPWRRELLREHQEVMCGTGNPEKVDRLKNKLREACSVGESYAGLARTFYRVYEVESVGI